MSTDVEEGLQLTVTRPDVHAFPAGLVVGRGRRRRPAPASARDTASPVIAHAVHEGAHQSIDPDVDEVRVVEAEGERGAEAGEQPEAHDHRRLWPSEMLEVVVERRDLEDAPVEQAEARHLDDDRQRLGDEQPADQDQQQLGVRRQRQAREGCTDGERAGVTHEDRTRARRSTRGSPRSRRASPLRRRPGPARVADAYTSG